MVRKGWRWRVTLNVLWIRWEEEEEEKKKGGIARGGEEEKDRIGGE